MGNKMKRFLSTALVLAMLSTNSLTALATESVDSTQKETQAASTVSSEEANTSAATKNERTGETYESVTDALFTASEGDTVTLLKDEEVSLLSVIDDVTLDLNGHTLKASYVTCFGNIVDQSEDNTGLLQVESKRFLIQEKNEQLPIKTGGGYKFFEVSKFNKAWQKDLSRYSFQTCVEPSALELIMQGTEVTGVTVNVRVSWTQGDGLRTQDFTYTDEMANKFFGSYDSETSKFGQMFTLVLNGTSAFEELTFSAVMVSDTGVEIASDSITVDTKEDTQNPDDTEKPDDTENPGSTGSSDVTTDENNKVTGDVQIEAGQASANVSAGTQLDENTNELKLTVKEMDVSDNTIEVEEKEEVRSVDVHVDGIAENNTVPIIVTVDEFAPEFLNQGNIRLYHVEDGTPVEMTRVFSLEEVDEHNEYYYDPATGVVTMAMATFSEVAVVADTTKAWEGKFDYSWYDASKTELTIANADQLAAFGAIVGGMNADATPGEGDSFKYKTVKLLADINLSDEEENNNSNIIFYPIGYYNSTGSYERESGEAGKDVTSSVSSFEGTFDGNGHTISNFYQNTWEMFGDYNSGYSGTPNYYKDAMGLFGYVYGGTVKNLTVDNFSSDGEFTPTGVIAAYADGDSKFENIAITNCNPRVYNTGNGGIVGIAGDTSTVDDDHLTFSNITVDNSNIISALWGSWDVACGGLVGMYRGNVDGNGNATGDTISFNNCHVSAQIDVYNDVCANYQYYAYRYAGMIIGSVRHNTTNDDEKTIPNMTGISASGCTVNYGDWNDYYYCEFEKNSMASYSEDYQFSRVPHSELNFTDSNGNGVVDADERDSVTGCKHTHTAEENHQAIYLPFHQLFTGYSWGVSSIGIEELEGIENITVAVGDQEESIVKFVVKGIESIEAKTEITIGDLFSPVEDVEINDSAVRVAVTAMGDSKISATFTSNETDWEKSKLVFDSIDGMCYVTIQDYNFCKPTTIILKDGKLQDVFISKFTGDFLYRVGNAEESTVALSTLFDYAVDENIIDDYVGEVSVNISNIEGNANGEYRASETDWKNNVIQFSGTGVVKVRIQDDKFCKPIELLLEVVDATNLTTAIGTTSGGNFVLLKDVNTSTYMNYWNCTLYGNGFTYSLEGAPNAYNSKQGKGILITKNATLDNLVIVGDIYESYGAYTNQDYYNTVIDVQGDTTIQNCYISGCAAPVRARNNVTIKNTTLYGGAVGNFILESGTATLEDITTANYDDGRAVVGMGIVIHSDATEAAKLVLNGTLTQYNFISESKVPTDTYAKNLHDAMFSSNCSQYQFGASPNRFVNTGIVSLTSGFNGEDITDNANTGYEGKALKVSSYGGYVYTQLNTSGSVNNNCPKYVSTTQGAVPPSYSFDYTNKNYVAKADGSNDYCYEENGTVNISMDEGDTFNWDTSILTIGKGISNYTVSMNGTDYTGKSIAFNTAGDYIVKYTYTDENNYKLDENGNITTYSMTYTKTVNITVAVVKATTKHAEFTFGSSDTASTAVTVGNNTYVMPNVSGTSSTIGSTTVSGQTIYYPIVEIIMSDGKTSHTSGWYAYFPVFSGAVTITDYADKGTGDKMTPYNGSTTTMPSGLSVVGDAKTLFKYQSGSNAGETPVVKNNILVYSSAKIEAKRNEYSTVVQYSYTDNAGATYYYYIGYHAPAQTYSPGCVTPDTLVTLADGTQKRIDEITYEDKLLVWNFYTGEYDAVPSAVIFDHGYGDNTVIKLKFADETEVKVINVHQLYDATTNGFVDITKETIDSFVGHDFIKRDGNGYTTVKLVDYEISEEYIEAYGIISAEHYNILVENMLSTDFMLEDKPLFNYFKIGDDLVFDSEKMQADIDKYGLYTYEDFRDYLTEEQFEAFNVKYMKVPVGKGNYTYEGILALIDEYLK